MNERVHFSGFSRRRKVRQDKWKRRLAQLAQMRAAKARKRLALIASGEWEITPKLVRWHRFEFGVRDKLSGETHFVDLKSVRHAAKALGYILKFCQ